jgi:hypothetical protein
MSRGAGGLDDLRPGIISRVQALGSWDSKLGWMTSKSNLSRDLRMSALESVLLADARLYPGCDCYQPLLHATIASGFGRPWPTQMLESRRFSA